MGNSYLYQQFVEHELLSFPPVVSCGGQKLILADFTIVGKVHQTGQRSVAEGWQKVESNI